MAIVFSYRSGDENSFDARYAGGRKTGVALGGADLTNIVDATAIGGRSVSFTTAANWHLLHWDAAANTPNNRTISIVMRYSPDYTGAPASRRALWAISAGAGATAPGVLQLYHELTTGAMTVSASNETGTTILNFVSFGNWTTNVAGTWYDIVFTWDGTNTANAAKLYIDGVLFGQLTATGSLTSSWTNNYRRSIMIGAGPTSTGSDGKLNELVILDSVIDPTSNVNLESGLGLLNGASRTSLISDVAGSPMTSYEGIGGGGIQHTVVGLGNNKLMGG